jgi:hypothetical protein
MHWRYASSGKAASLQAQSTEFKNPIPIKKKKNPNLLLIFLQGQLCKLPKEMEFFLC